MRTSARTAYGLKAVLLLASRFGEGSLSVSQIGKKEDISIAYLEQILNALKKKGFVKSVRGPQGGYVLAKKPSEISLKTLFEVLEDENTPVADGHGAVSPQSDETTVGSQLFWKKLQESIDEGLGKTTLKDLIDEARRLKKTKSSSPYAFNI